MIFLSEGFQISLVSVPGYYISVADARKCDRTE